MPHHKVKDHPGLVRDVHTNAVLNVDKNVLSKHKQIMTEREKREKLESELNTLSRNVEQLTLMMQELIKERSK